MSDEVEFPTLCKSWPKDRETPEPEIPQDIIQAIEAEKAEDQAGESEGDG